MNAKKWLVKKSSIEAGVKWWFLYEFLRDPRDPETSMTDILQKYSTRDLVDLRVLEFKKRYSSEEELELEVMLIYGGSAEMIELPKPTPFTEL